MAYILVIDDDEELAAATAGIVREDGHEVTVLNETDQAIATVRRRVPDVVILDIMFPASCCGGLDLARQLRQEFGALPILMISAVNKEFHLGFSSEDIDPDWLPITEFIEKPIDFSILKKTIGRLLETASGAGRSR
jgi:CheY-like chemotaxis protein